MITKFLVKEASVRIHADGVTPSCSAQPMDGTWLTASPPVQLPEIRSAVSCVRLSTEIASHWLRLFCPR